MTPPLRLVPFPLPPPFPLLAVAGVRDVGLVHCPLFAKAFHDDVDIEPADGIQKTSM